MNIDSHIYSFQYRLITCYVLLLISLTVFAQSGKERFSGRVIDTETYRGCVKTLAQPLLYFTVLLYFLLAMLLFPHAFGNKLLYSNYIGL